MNYSSNVLRFPTSASSVSMATQTHKLAQPKPNRLRHPDRRSVYFLDRLPPEKTGSTTRTELTPRWSELCRSKRFYTQVTLSPIWEVSEWALRAVPSDRLCSLAQPRPPAAGWQQERPLLARLNRVTQTAVATSRICQLAQPKTRPVLEGFGPKSKAVAMTHIPCKASAHIELLATPKHDHPKFEGERSVCWSVSREARNFVASQRLLELSSPKERSALFEGYDPYVVSQAARSASPSPRIRQLCLPLPRKCSSI
ncbi:sperm microtubule associated protein 2 isoform X1 [Anarrhichthys ocellatus]|uniref:sperm microtubule associated protein 2 isoform X1 n=1 Tax=Anarrhichthys ocellatus TaxID=433405 RepID=UPI0012ED813F|nr:testicular haploid expressed gene protein isoform X1 [Anarrhichthys ocellatus]